MNNLIIMLAIWTIVDIVVVIAWIIGKIISIAYEKLMNKRG